MPTRRRPGTPGRPSLPEKQRRRSWFTLRVSDEERDVIQRRADQRRMPVAVYVRRGAYRGWVRQTGVGNELMRIAAELIERAEALSRRRDPSLQEVADELERVAERLRAQIPHL